MQMKSKPKRRYYNDFIEIQKITRDYYEKFYANQSLITYQEWTYFWTSYQVCILKK